MLPSLRLTLCAQDHWIAEQRGAGLQAVVPSGGAGVRGKRSVVSMREAVELSRESRALLHCAVRAMNGPFSAL